MKRYVPIILAILSVLGGIVFAIEIVINHIVDVNLYLAIAGAFVVGAMVFILPPIILVVGKPIKAGEYKGSKGG